MKKSLLLGVSAWLLCAAAAMAQSTGLHKMLVEGKQWHYTHRWLTNEEPYVNYEHLSMELKGDTVVNGQAYFKLYLCTPSDTLLYACCHEDDDYTVSAIHTLGFRYLNGVWSAVPVADAEPCEIYRLGTDVTQSSPLNVFLRDAIDNILKMRFAQPEGSLQRQFFLNRIDLSDVEGMLRRVVQFNFIDSDGDNCEGETWVAGVGAPSSGIMEPSHGMVPTNGEMLIFDSCVENSRCIYRAEHDYSLVAKDDYRPMVENGKRWTVCLQGDETSEPSYGHYLLQGDTLIAGQPCLKLYAGQTTAGAYVGALRETERKVYFYEAGTFSGRLLYDFSLAMLDKAEVEPQANRFYSMQKSGDLYDQYGGNVWHSLLLFEQPASADTPESNPALWIEGVGSALGPLAPYGFNLSGNAPQLVACSVQGQWQFRAGSYAGTDGVKVPSVAGQRESDAALYDLSGRQLQGAPQRKGIYISGGKKVVR